MEQLVPDCSRLLGAEMLRYAEQIRVVFLEVLNIEE